MAKQPSTRGAGSRLGRTESVSIRLDPRLNYLCELAARSQRRTKSSFIEATIAEKIDAFPINNWRDHDHPESIGGRADYLWHVRESQRLISLGFVAPHLMTFEEQSIWSFVSENGYFWLGQWRDDTWTWKVQESSIQRERVDEKWELLVEVAHGTKDPDVLPKVSKQSGLNGPVPTGDIDDETPF